MIKGIISGIKRMEIHDGDGLRTTVFFKGCPLKCIWCHNPESISFLPQTAFFRQKCIDCKLCKGKKNANTAKACPTGALTQFGQEFFVDELAEQLVKDKTFFDYSGGGVTLSGGECLAQGEFCISLAKKLKQKNVSVYVDTCGFVKQETFKKILPYVDKFLFDVKAFSKEVHKKCTGEENGLILQNLKFLSDSKAKIEVRIPLVKGYNDGEIEDIAKLLSNLNVQSVKVLKYHSLARSRYQALEMPDTMPQTETTLADVDKAVKTLKKYGLNAFNGESEG